MRRGRHLPSPYNRCRTKQNSESVCVSGTLALLLGTSHNTTAMPKVKRSSKPKRLLDLRVHRRCDDKLEVHQFWHQPKYNGTFLPTVVASAVSLARAGCLVRVWSYHTKRPDYLPHTILFCNARDIVPEETFRGFAKYAKRSAWHLCQFADYFRITLLATQTCGMGGMAWSDSDNLVMPGRDAPIPFLPEDNGLILASCL